jgi:hypothetical protein
MGIKLNRTASGAPARIDGTRQGFSWAEFHQLTDGMTTQEKSAFWWKRWPVFWLRAMASQAIGRESHAPPGEYKV